MKYIKTFEKIIEGPGSNSKYWKIPIDDYFFPKLSKINVPKWEQNSCYKHYLSLLKEKNPVKFIYVFQDPYSSSGFNESFNPNSYQKLQDDGYIKQDDNYIGPQQNQRLPKKGDFVFLKYPEYVDIENVFNRPKNFFDTHIGEIIKKTRITSFQKLFGEPSTTSYTIKFDSLKHNLLNEVPTPYIKIFSENKEDLESIIKSKKYNL